MIGASTFAHALSRIHLARIHFERGARGERMIKERLWFNGIAIRIGNWLCRGRSVPVEVLRTEDWLSWEINVQWLVNGIAVTRRGKRTLEIPKFSGDTLNSILRSPASNLGQRLAATRACVRALRCLHEVQLPPRGQPLSHGDATARNVIVDVMTDRAVWIDFDTRHDMRHEAISRQADDLRAIIYSSAAFFRPEECSNLVHSVVDAYGNSLTWTVLERMIRAKLLDSDLFHLAQSECGSRQRRNIFHALLKVLSQLPSTNS